ADQERHLHRARQARRRPQHHDHGGGAAAGPCQPREPGGLRGVDRVHVSPYRPDMALPMIKSTYTLDVATVRTLEALARRWKVSKSEALRRAIRSASGQTPPPAPEALAAL